jgi:D-isomer specific 2-hydroxyacid dehydrogenase, catalytic domain
MVAERSNRPSSTRSSANSASLSRGVRAPAIEFAFPAGEIRRPGGSTSSAPAVSENPSHAQTTRRGAGLVISSGPATRKVLSALEELKVIAQTGVGYDVIDVRRIGTMNATFAGAAASARSGRCAAASERSNGSRRGNPHDDDRLALWHVGRPRLVRAMKSCAIREGCQRAVFAPRVRRSCLRTAKDDKQMPSETRAAKRRGSSEATQRLKLPAVSCARIPAY